MKIDFLGVEIGVVWSEICHRCSGEHILYVLIFLNPPSFIQLTFRGHTKKQSHEAAPIQSLKNERTDL